MIVILSSKIHCLLISLTSFYVIIDNYKPNADRNDHHSLRPATTEWKTASRKRFVGLHAACLIRSLPFFSCFCLCSPAPSFLTPALLSLAMRLSLVFDFIVSDCVLTLRNFRATRVTGTHTFPLLFFLLYLLREAADKIVPKTKSRADRNSTRISKQSIRPDLS